MLSLADIIDLAGGVEAIAKALRARAGKPGVKTVTASAIYKWRHNGVPDVYWPLIIHLAGVTAADLLAANAAARDGRAPRSAAP